MRTDLFHYRSTPTVYSEVDNKNSVCETSNRALAGAATTSISVPTFDGKQIVLSFSSTHRQYPCNFEAVENITVAAKRNVYKRNADLVASAPIWTSVGTVANVEYPFFLLLL